MRRSRLGLSTAADLFVVASAAIWRWKPNAFPINAGGVGVIVAGLPFCFLFVVRRGADAAPRVGESCLLSPPAFFSSSRIVFVSLGTSFTDRGVAFSRLHGVCRSPIRGDP